MPASLSEQIVPTWFQPPCLATLAADYAVKCFIYEDYGQCDFYRWDPVRIWQYEIPQPKKKKNKNVIASDFSPPPWRAMKKFRDWYWKASVLGNATSSLRQHIAQAIERRQWTANSEEEEVLFILLRLCLDFSISFDNGTISSCIPSDWIPSLCQVIGALGPFPLQKLTVSSEADRIYGINGEALICAIISCSPDLKSINISHWDASSEVFRSLQRGCPYLQEFTISSMMLEVFMSDESLFSCFFDGASPEEVLYWKDKNINPRLTFRNLKYVDILLCRQLDRFITMLVHFYPNVCLSDFHVGALSELAEPSWTLNILRMTFGTSDLVNGKVKQLMKNISYVKEIRVFGSTDDCVIDQNSYLDAVSSKLKELLCTMKSVDSLCLQPSTHINILKSAVPVLFIHGHLLHKLELSYSSVPVSRDMLYQLLNLCPQLMKFVLLLNVYGTNGSLYKGRTTLNKLQSLETLIIRHAVSDIADSGEINDDNLYVDIASEILGAAVNVEFFGLSCALSIKDELTILSSNTVQRMFLEYDPENRETPYDLPCNQLIMNLLKNFPRLKNLFLYNTKTPMWQEGMQTMTCTNILVSFKYPEVAVVPLWKTSMKATTTSFWI